MRISLDPLACIGLATPHGPPGWRRPGAPPPTLGLFRNDTTGTRAAADFAGIADMKNICMPR